MRIKIDLCVVFLILLSVLCGCGSGKEAGEESEGSARQEENHEPLVVEAQELDYTAKEIKPAGEIQNTDGYYVTESFRKDGLAEEEWKNALEPFQEQLALRVRDDSFVYEGKEETSVRGMYRDQAGYTYIIAGQSIRMIGPDGKIVTQYDYNSAGGDGAAGAYAGDAIVSDAGKIVFPVSRYDEVRDTNQITIVSFDPQTGTENVLGRMEDQFFRNPLCALRGSKLFYRSNEWIICWDIATGERTRFFDLKSAGTNDRNVIMGFDEEGVPMLYIGGEVTVFNMPNALGDETVVVLGSQPPQAGMSIRIADVRGNFDNGYVASCAGMYGIANRDVQIDYHTEEDIDAYRTRVLAEIAAGKEADILCVDEIDLHMLWERGAIAPVEELLSRDTLDALLPGVKELCMVDGEMAAVVPAVYVSALSTNRQDWGRDTWSMREFMEQMRKQEKKYAVMGPRGSSGWCSAWDLMNFFVLPSLEGMGLIDLQSGAANLDSEEYRELLRFCREYGRNRDLDADEYEECLKDREALSNIHGFICAFSGFEKIYGNLYEEGDCNLVGFPAGDTSYNYFIAPKWLAVSARAAADPEKREAIAAFLEYLLSEERQKTIDYYFGVRRPTAETCYETDLPAVEVDGIYSKEIIVFGKQEYACVKKSDGSIYLEDFTEFLESCRAQPFFSSDLNKIIISEAELYFKGERELEETARVTQNRVQLYLDERKY